MVLGVLVGMSVPARAEDVAPSSEEAKGPWPQKPHWDPAWSHSNPWDYTLAGLSLGVFAFEGLVLQPVRPTMRWMDPILFDSDVRAALRVTDPQAQQTLQNVGWVLWGAQIAIPLFVDIPYAWTRYGFGLARDLFWQDAATLLLAAAVDLGLRDLAGRARPSVYDCLKEGGTDCLSSTESTRSFPGGHLLNATAASVLTCTQHLYVRLYGGPWDALTCAMTLTSDVTLGVMRVVQDTHWATDELAGLVIGALIGWGVPYAMHFRKSDDADVRAPAALVLPMPMAFDHGGGLGAAGIF